MESRGVERKLQGEAVFLASELYFPQSKELRESQTELRGNASSDFLLTVSIYLLHLRPFDSSSILNV